MVVFIRSSLNRFEAMIIVWNQYFICKKTEAATQSNFR